MQPSVSFLLLLLVLLTIGQCAASRQKRVWQRYPFMTQAKQHKLKTLLISPLKNLTHFNREKLLQSCQASGSNCTRAEDCCTLICWKRHKKCGYIENVLIKAATL